MATTPVKKNTRSTGSAQAAKKAKPAVSGAALASSVYDQKGKVTGSIELPQEIFGLPWNADLVHQVITSMTSNARANNAHTKMRGEVSGTGKKPWKQKGTGRARHGSMRSPIWVGGGIAHGPRNDRNYDKKINKKMKTKALFTLLSKKFKNNQVLFVSDIEMAEIKTKNAAAITAAFAKVSGFERIEGATKRTSFLALPAKNTAVEKSFANLANVMTGDIRNLSPLDVVQYRFMIIANPEAALKALVARTK